MYKTGKKVFIAATLRETCPVTHIKRYLASVGLVEVLHSNCHAFHRIQFSQGRSKLVKTNIPRTYMCTSAKEALISCSLDQAGYDSRSYGLHSFRYGGASAAASNGINDRLLKMHGRWKSDVAKDGYMEQDLDVLLTVSRSLGV